MNHSLAKSEEALDSSRHDHHPQYLDVTSASNVAPRPASSLPDLSLTQMKLHRSHHVALKPLSLKEMEDELSRLRKENFSLKLRIHLFEEGDSVSFHDMDEHNLVLTYQSRVRELEEELDRRIVEVQSESSRSGGQEFRQEMERRVKHMEKENQDLREKVTVLRDENETLKRLGEWTAEANMNADLDGGDDKATGRQDLEDISIASSSSCQLLSPKERYIAELQSRLVDYERQMEEVRAELASSQQRVVELEQMPPMSAGGARNSSRRISDGHGGWLGDASVVEGSMLPGDSQFFNATSAFGGGLPGRESNAGETHALKEKVDNQSGLIRDLEKIIEGLRNENASLKKSKRSGSPATDGPPSSYGDSGLDHDSRLHSELRTTVERLEGRRCVDAMERRQLMQQIDQLQQELRSMTQERDRLLIDIAHMKEQEGNLSCDASIPSWANISGLDASNASDLLNRSLATAEDVNMLKNQFRSHRSLVNVLLQRLQGSLRFLDRLLKWLNGKNLSKDENFESELQALIESFTGVQGLSNDIENMERKVEDISTSMQEFNATAASFLNASNTSGRVTDFPMEGTGALDEPRLKSTPLDDRTKTSDLKKSDGAEFNERYDQVLGDRQTESAKFSPIMYRGTLDIGEIEKKLKEKSVENSKLEQKLAESEKQRAQLGKDLEALRSDLTALANERLQATPASERHSGSGASSPEGVAQQTSSPWPEADRDMRQLKSESLRVDYQASDRRRENLVKLDGGKASDQKTLDKLAQAEERLDMRARELNTLQNELRASVTENNKLKTQMGDLTSNMDSMRSKLQAKEDDISQLLANEQAWSSQQKNWQKSLENMIGESSQQKLEIRKLSDEIRRFMHKNAQTESDLEDCRHRLEAAQRERESLTAQLQEKSQKIANLESEIQQSFKPQIWQLERKLAALQDENDLLGGQKSTLETEFMSTTLQGKEKNSEIMALSDQLEIAQTEKNSLDKELDSFKLEHQKLESAYDFKESELADLRSKMSQLIAGSEEAVMELRKMEEREKLLDIKEQEIEELRAKLSSTSDLARQRLIQLDEAKTNCRALQDVTETLHKEVTALKSAMAQDFPKGGRIAAGCDRRSAEYRSPKDSAVKNGILAEISDGADNSKIRRSSDEVSTHRSGEVNFHRRGSEESLRHNGNAIEDSRVDTVDKGSNTTPRHLDDAEKDELRRRMEKLQRYANEMKAKSKRSSVDRAGSANDLLSPEARAWSQQLSKDLSASSERLEQWLRQEQQKGVNLEAIIRQLLANNDELERKTSEQTTSAANARREFELLAEELEARNVKIAELQRAIMKLREERGARERQLWDMKNAYRSLKSKQVLRDLSNGASPASGSVANRRPSSASPNADAKTGYDEACADLTALNLVDVGGDTSFFLISSDNRRVLGQKLLESSTEVKRLRSLLDELVKRGVGESGGGRSASEPKMAESVKASSRLGKLVNEITLLVSQSMRDNRDRSPEHCCQHLSVENEELKRQIQKLQQELKNALEQAMSTKPFGANNEAMIRATRREMARTVETLRKAKSQKKSS